MPWTIADVDSKKQGLSKKQKEEWVSTANTILKECVDKGGSDDECAPRAIKIANSKFCEVLIPKEIHDVFKEVYAAEKLNNFNPIFDQSYQNKILNSKAWAAVHERGWFKNKEGKWVKRKFTGRPKNFQYQKSTPPDPRDGHVHMAAFDEDGNGGTSEAGDTPHVHAVFGFKVQPYYYYDQDSDGEYVSVHPGSLAFKDSKTVSQNQKNMSEMGECEMEIFRPGTWNDEEFTEKDLCNIADNFRALKNELKPKLKITHHGEEKEQESLAGLASYGDVVDVYLKRVADGSNRLFALIKNIPKEVLSWIKDRRFAERSIEIYPEFKEGTSEDSPVYKNVLKAIALLGHEMPAVTGMSPIRLQECYECQGTECVIQKFEAPGDTETVLARDEQRGSEVQSHEDIEGDEGTIKCSQCSYDIPIEKLENDNTGYSQCPQCGAVITREKLEVMPAEKELARIELGIKILKSQLEIEEVLK